MDRRHTKHFAILFLDTAGEAFPVQLLKGTGVWWGGGGVSWHFHFAREISRFKLNAKFRTQNSGFSANFSHTSGTHCGLWRVVIYSTRGLLEISHSEILHHEFDLARSFPPSRTALCLAF